MDTDPHRLTTQAPQRRAFLRGRFRARPARPRPFGALPEAAFLQACTGCGDCAAACGQDIIRRDGDGLAVIDAHAGECVFCGDCVTACTTGALVADGGWPWRAALGEGCLHHQGITCRACEDMCEPRAIRFRPQPGGHSLPQLSQADCTGCMACIGACPEGAITLLAAPRPVAPSPFQEANPC